MEKAFNEILRDEFVESELKIGDLFSTHFLYKKIRGHSRHKCLINGSLKIVIERIAFHDDLHRVQHDFEGTVSYIIGIEAYTLDGLHFKVTTAGLSYKNVEEHGYYAIERRLIESWNAFNSNFSKGGSYVN